MSELIIANIVVLSLIALAAALVLYFAAQKFKVAGNPLADKIAALLPQANCGACGKAGCQDLPTPASMPTRKPLPTCTARSAAAKS